MAGLGLGLTTLGDLVSSILIPPPDDPSTDSVPISVVTVPVTVTATVTLTTSSTTSSTTTSTTSSHSTSISNGTSTSSTTSTTSSLTGSDLITTTFLTSQGTSLIEITAVVTNPAGHVHNDQSTGTSAFFDNRTAVIGVFTVVGIVAFAVAAALIAWMTRRRTLKQRRREEVDKSSRDFFEDEVNDAGDPSEKSWWGNASGASIPGGVPLQPVTSMGYGSVPPVPPLPSEFSHNSAASPSVASRSPLLSDGGLSFPHPYAGTGSSLVSDNYSNNIVTHDRSGSATTGWTSSTREPTQSPPTSPLPAVPYRGQAANNGVYLPLIHEGTPNSLSPSVPYHPFASPPTNRRSELYPEDVLWGFGTEGGVGRSLSGKRPVEPPVPVRPPETVTTLPIPPPNQPHMPPTQHHAVLQQPQYLFHPANDASRGKQSPVESSRLTPEHNIADTANSRIRPTSGISEGGWYDDSNSEIGRAALVGATASGESFLNSNAGRNDRYGYPYTAPNRSQSRVDKSAATSAAELPEKKSTTPHDPRFSGLFGNVAVAQSRGDSPLSHGRQSQDLDEESEEEEEHFTNHSHGGSGGSGNRVLRVTNE